ncbi:MAG: hypothetical protein RR303_04990 [Bacteroidales bacterium]
MKKQIVLSLAFVCCMNSCQKEEAGVEDMSEKVAFYEQSHRTVMQIKGLVKEIREYNADPQFEEEKMLSAVIAFNEAGNIASYDPTGMEEEISTFWIPVNVERYEYDYDEYNRLRKIKVMPLGEEPAIYTLIYGEHSTYIPLPIEIKPIGEWLVKGLVSVESERADFSYQFDGTKVSFVQQDFGKKEQGTIQFENGYPVMRKSQTIESGVAVASKETKYSFDSLTGILLRKECDLTEDNKNTVSVYEYDSKGLCIRQTDTSLNEMAHYEYQYNSYSWLIATSVKRDGTESNQSRLYDQPDDHGNWTRCEINTKGFIDWGSIEGKVIVTRTLHY